jgi:hypothetical protein
MFQIIDINSEFRFNAFVTVSPAVPACTIILGTVPLKNVSYTIITAELGQFKFSIVTESFCNIDLTWIQ